MTETLHRELGELKQGLASMEKNHERIVSGQHEQNTSIQELAFSIGKLASAVETHLDDQAEQRQQFENIFGRVNSLEVVNATQSVTLRILAFVAGSAWVAIMGYTIKHFSL